MASILLGGLYPETANAEFSPRGIFPLNWQSLRAFSFSYFRKVRLLLNVTALQTTLGILDLYFLSFGRKYAILVSI